MLYTLTIYEIPYIIKEVEVVDTMPNNAEVIEKLARQLEHQKFLNDLQSCETLEDFKALVEKYKTICENENK